MFYQRLINEDDPTINPAGVEASMRLQYGVLDHLPRETFHAETEVARQCETESPGYLRGVAVSYGLGEDYDAWENSKGRLTTDADLVLTPGSYAAVQGLTAL